MPANPYETIVWEQPALEQYDGWLNLDATFRSRLLALFAASGGQLGFGEGYRTAEQQAAGAEAKPGIVAPQGKSWHEVGMAVDLTGPAVTNGWLEENAERFGLKTFANVNNEPWHVQPIEIPNARPQGAPAPSLSGSVSGGESVSSTGPMELPPDAQIYNIAGTYEVWAVFDVGGGVRIGYEVDTSQGAVDWKSSPTSTVDRGQWDQMGVVNAGSSAELSTFQTGPFSTYREFWDAIIDQVMGPYNPARNDPEVMRVVAEFASRPDMGEVELASKLQRTNWYRTRTEEQLEWNGLQPAEQEKRTEEAAARAADTWFQFTGERIDPSDPRIANYAVKLASGEMGWGAFSQLVKGRALDNPESPWARDVRAEQEAQRQRPIDIENTAQNIRDTLSRWGLQWTAGEIERWAKGIVEKRYSDEDLMQTVKTAASTLYPWKDPEQETIQAAQPWLSTYERLMERSGTLQTREVQRALTQGTPVYEFEQDLRRTDEWALGTRNGRDELVSIASEVGRRMGFE